MATTGMPWFRLEPEFERHPKVRLLCRALNDPNASIYVVRLWCWTSTFFPKGRIEADDRFLESELLWIGDASKLITELIGVGLLDREEDGSGFVVHGWHQRNAKQYSKFLKDRKRRKTKGKSDVENPQGTRAEPVRVPNGQPAEPARNPQATVRNGTVRNGTSKDPMSAGADGGQGSLGIDTGGAAPPSKAQPFVEQVWEHFRATISPSSSLNKKRRDLIQKRLEGDSRQGERAFSVSELKRCIDGYRVSPHHNGENSTGTKYLDIELFLRDAKHVEAGWGFVTGTASSRPHPPAYTPPAPTPEGPGPDGEADRRLITDQHRPAFARRRDATGATNAG